jgi:hypothetical protein
MKHYVTAIMLAAGLLFACNGDQAHDTSHDHNHPGITLNNGEKWSANPETTQGIKNMTNLIAALPADPTSEEYHALHASLEQEFEMIFEKCTMTGEAHNQLHNYLLPLKDMVGALDTDSKEECRETTVLIKEHLEEYGNYFQ